MTSEELKQGVLDTLFKFADRFGIPVVMLAVLIWFAREAAIAMHETLVKPVVESHIEFLDVTRETLSEIGATQEKQNETLREIASGQREIKETLRTANVAQPNDEPTN
jgi:hypothetical protein